MVRLATRCLGIAALTFISTEAVAQRADKFSQATKQFITADQPEILIKDARLFDGVHPAVRDHQDVLVRNGRIAAIGKVKSPADAKVIDAAGKTLMPGLVMMHEHLMAMTQVGNRPLLYTNPYVPQVMLAYGTTTARTAGGFDMEGDLALKRQIDAGKVPGSDLDVSVYIEGPQDPILTLPAIANAAAAHREVAYWAERGATSVKIFFDATPDVVQGAIAEAKARHMTVAGHLCATRAVTAARLGLDTLEHGLLAAYDLLPGADEKSCPKRERQVGMLKQMATLDANGPEVGNLLKALLTYKVALTPTLATREAYLCSPIAPPPARERALLMRPDVIEAPAPCFAGLNAEIEKKGLAFQAATAVRYHKMGGTLLVGTDGWLVQGAGGPREMEALVESGLSPTEVLQAATIAGARAIHRDKDIGSIEVGKRADLLLVDGKPDQTISDIRKLSAVFKDGIGYDPAKLYDEAKGKIVN